MDKVGANIKFGIFSGLINSVGRDCCLFFWFTGLDSSWMQMLSIINQGQWQVQEGTTVIEKDSLRCHK